MTDAEIVALVARVIDRSAVFQAVEACLRKRDDFLQAVVESHDDVEQVRTDYLAAEDNLFLVMSSAVVAALTEAGRLVPDGCVAIPRYQWDRVKTGDLDAEPTP